MALVLDLNVLEKAFDLNRISERNWFRAGLTPRQMLVIILCNCEKSAVSPTSSGDYVILLSNANLILLSFFRTR